MSGPTKRPYSSQVVDGLEKAAARAMLHAVGFSEADFSKPQVGIASTWSNLTPCNVHINELAEAAAIGAEDANAKAITFNTITVSDGISMGSPGMRYSLVSREVIADSIETVVAGQGFDGFVAIGGCDKNMPGCAIAMARLNRPSVFVYGGTIRPGKDRRDVVSVFEAVGQYASGNLSELALKDIEATSIPGPGSCGGMYTANTMSSSFEALGMSLMSSSTMANPDPETADNAAASARVLVEAVKAGIRPRDIITRRSIENAVALIMATGGSTNGVLHFMAIAHAAEVEWTLDDFERVRRKVPVICDLRPSGQYMAVDLHQVGGVPQVLKILLNAGLIHGDCLTITGRTLAEELAGVPDAPPAGQTVIRPIDQALYGEGHLAILKGNLATGGAVAKISGLKNPVISGPARVFDDEASAMDAILSDRIRPGDVLVLRYLGPRGGPGMPQQILK